MWIDASLTSRKQQHSSIRDRDAVKTLLFNNQLCDSNKPTTRVGADRYIRLKFALVNQVLEHVYRTMDHDIPDPHLGLKDPILIGSVDNLIAPHNAEIHVGHVS